jgi:hypothetical protein
MNKADSLRKKFDEDLKNLQETCKHEKTSDDVLTSEMFMHFSRMARFCLDCNKEFPPLKAQPIFEISTFTSPVPVNEAIKQLGYQSPEELREERLAEELMDDPRVKKVMADYLIRELEKQNETP